MTRQIAFVCGNLEPSLQLHSGAGFDNGAINMRAIIAIVLGAATLAACTPDNDVTGSIGSCARNLYSPYNPKDMKQCVGVCIGCDRGVTTTCTTSCTLKGAH